MARPLAICLAGHVDHGKSSLLGRLLHELDLLPRGKVAKLEAASASRGVPLEWSFALDSLQLERDQAVTLDTTRVHVRTPRREMIVIDCPGHRELVRNLVTGAAGTTAALLVVDGQLGAEAQTRAHAALLRLLGIRDFVVAVNKMDALDWKEERFNTRRDEIAEALGLLGVVVHAIVPTSARDGGNLVVPAAASWLNGPTLVDALEALPAQRYANADAPLRLPVQDVYRSGTRRVVAGRIAQGTLRPGAELMVLPSGARAHVATLDGWPRAPESATAGDNVALTFAEPVIVERGDLLCAAAAPARLTAVFDADIFWLGREPLAVGYRCELRAGTRAVAVRVAAILHALDVNGLAPQQASVIATNGLGRITLRCDLPVAVDDVTECLETGRFVLADAGVIVGGGLISAGHYPDQRRALPATNDNVVGVDHQVSAPERRVRAGHVGAIVWLTGLSGAGKSTLAMALERALFDRGWAAYTIDGDNVRRGLNADLGFSPGDRQENIRRVGEVAALFADAGLVCITAFISPFDDDRARARAAAGSRRFFEVYVRSELATCEARDPKGLYGKARRGEIKGFTGIDSPYEVPATPDLVIDTQHETQAACIAQLVEFVTANCQS
ncbi:MAG: adenylyl-sulfate kinase [Betaproteobacteria bacterium]